MKGSWDQLISAFTLDNPTLLIAAAITFAIGYIQYIYSWRLMVREKKGPFPVQMHTFYLAHDSSMAIWGLIAGFHYNSWFCFVLAGSLFIWNIFEIWCIYRAVTIERQEIFGHLYPNPVTVRQAIAQVVGQLAVMYSLVNVLIWWMGGTGDNSLFQFGALTNVVMVVVPGLLWMKRGAQDGTRYGTSMGLAIIGVICAIVTFAPFGMFVTAQPDKFNTPIFYILGCVCTLIAVIYVWILSKIPPKQKVAGEKAPIW